MDQPPPSYPPPPAGAVRSPGAGRPGAVTAAGVMLIILGALAALGGILFVLGGAFLASADVGEQFADQFGGQFVDLVGAATGILIVLGLLAVVYAVFKIIAGAKVFGLSNGWRITGIVLCAVAIVGWIFSLIGAITGGEEARFEPGSLDFTTVSTGPSIGGIVVAILFLAANITTLVLLARTGSAFRR